MTLRTGPHGGPISTRHAASALLRAAVLGLAALTLAGCGLSAKWAYTNDEYTPERRRIDAAETPPDDPRDAQGHRSPERRRWLAARQFSFKPRVFDPANPCDAPRKAQPRVLVLLALSGGGHRASYFGALNMMGLQQVPARVGAPTNVLREVDVISAVSGGTLPAAYYVATADQGDTECPAYSGREWKRDEVAELMTTPYLSRWFASWFRWSSLRRFWTSGFDRTDIMAEVFADAMFSDKDGHPLNMMRVNPARPNLILNATVGSRAGVAEPNQFGSVFTFTQEDFAQRANSDIADYVLSRGVMASCTFPGVFSFMTLRDFNAKTPGEPERYIHLFDGGNSDNLGLTSIKRVLLQGEGGRTPVLNGYDKIVVLQIDSFIESTGADPHKADPRHLLDYVFDSNVADSSDALLEENRERLLREFKRRTLVPYEPTPEFDDRVEPNEKAVLPVLPSRDCQKDSLPADVCLADASWWNGVNYELARKLVFVHIDFFAVRNVALRNQLRSIPTTGLRKAGEPGAPIDDKAALEQGVESIFDPAQCPKDDKQRFQSICNCWEIVSEVLRDPNVDLTRFREERRRAGVFNYFCPLGERIREAQLAE